MKIHDIIGCFLISATLLYASCAALGKPVGGSQTPPQSQQSQQAQNVTVNPDGSKVVSFPNGSKVITDPAGLVTYTPPPVNVDAPPSGPTLWDTILGILAPIAGTLNPLAGVAVGTIGKIIGDNFIKKEPVKTA